MANENLPAGVTVIPNVSLEEFESKVYSREYEKATILLLQNLQRLKAGAFFIGYQPNQPKLAAMLYSRFCAAIVTLMLDKTTPARLSQQGFECLVSEHAIMDMVFRASVFETSDHMLPQIAENPTETDKNKLRLTDRHQMAKFFTVYSLRSGFRMKFEEAFKRNPQNLIAFWAGALSHLLTINKDAHERKEELLAMHGIFEDVKLSDSVLAVLSDAYMYSSYGVRRDKHAMKATVHKLMARMFEDHKTPVPSLDILQVRHAETKVWVARGAGPWANGKPTLLICLEWFNSMHAMFRCYVNLVRQLRTSFHVVGISQAAAIDEAAKGELDRWVEVKAQHVVLKDVVIQINEVRPDVIWYPSIGMALWWVATASLRLAPVQIMSLGHPASSQSLAIDYVMCEEGAVGDSSLYSETIVTYPVGAARFVMRADAEGALPALKENSDPVDGVVHVAVPAMLCKLNAPFMETLKRIALYSKTKVHFHFFVNMTGLMLHQASKEIGEWLDNASVYERTDYKTYMSHLNKCHVQLGTFPFGGTNSNIDSLLLGIPLVTLEGEDQHERYDAMMIRRAGLPEGLVAQSAAEYEAAAIQLIDDRIWRNLLFAHLTETADLKGEFFGEPPPEMRTAFVDTFWNTFMDHEVK